MRATCLVDACDRPTKAFGLCPTHYMRQRRHGDTTRRTNQGVPVAERFWDKVDRRGDDECWPWLAAKSARGYGRFKVGRQLLRAHRYAYEFLVGPIPDGLTIDHLCNQPSCVNPAHMEPVTHIENRRRATERRHATRRPPCPPQPS